MHIVKYRMTGDNLRPRRIKLEIPGWAGEPEPRVDGSHEYAWHCVPFSEAARYGIEVLYPYDNELTVRRRGGEIVFEGDFGAARDPERNWPPFRTFGENFYTYQLLLDLKVEPGYAVKIEPHPRFYTDASETTPIAVPALIRRWWPMLFFVVFKAPAEGCAHVFRKDEAFAQFTFVPEPYDFELVEMSSDEAAEREMQSRRIYDSRASLGADSQWTSSTDTVFDATYRRLHGAVRNSGE